MKKMLTIALTLIMALTFFSACGSKEDKEASKDTTQGALGDYFVAIKDGRKVTDEDGKDAFLVEVEFTNNGEEATTFMMSIMEKGYQNGVELDNLFYLPESENYDNGLITKSIQNGATITVPIVFSLSDSSELTVELTEAFSFTNKDKVVKTFTI